MYVIILQCWLLVEQPVKLHITYTLKTVKLRNRRYCRKCITVIITLHQSESDMYKNQSFDFVNFLKVAATATS